MSPFKSIRRVVAVAFALAPCLSAFAQDTPQIPSLEDYPPTVVEYVMRTFSAQRDGLIKRDANRTEEQSAVSADCASALENAHTVYLQAFKADALSKKRQLLLQAAAMPCYVYPVKTSFFSFLSFLSTKREIDYLGEIREAARIFANESVRSAALGDSDTAVTTLCGGFGFLDHIARTPSSLTQLTRYACQSLIVNAFRATLSSQALTDAQLQQLQAAIDRAYHPEALARTWLAERESTKDPDPFSYMSTVYVTDAAYRAQLLSARTAIAIERHLRANGALPDSLDELVPTFLASVPIDPLNGQPMTYQRLDGLYAVSSVDRDGEAATNVFAPDEARTSYERTLLVIPSVKKARAISEMPWSSYRHRNSKYSRAEEKAIIALVDALPPANLQPLCDGETRLTLSLGEVEGGIGVLIDECNADARSVPIQAAFWVHGGQVYTANPWAREITAGLPEAPESITFDKIRDEAR